MAVAGKGTSPAFYHDAKDPPTLILHGTIDDIVPVNQSDMLAKKLTEFKTPYVYDRIPGWPHTMDLARDINTRSAWMMEHFFARFLKDEKPSAK